MKVIVTKQNADGSFDEVGMNNRSIFSQFKTKIGAFRRMKQILPPGTYRLEFFTDNGIYGDPFDTQILEQD